MTAKIQISCSTTVELSACSISFILKVLYQTVTYKLLMWKRQTRKCLVWKLTKHRRVWSLNKVAVSHYHTRSHAIVNNTSLSCTHTTGNTSTCLVSCSAQTELTECKKSRQWTLVSLLTAWGFRLLPSLQILHKVHTTSCAHTER